jgi:hypothetical protein
LPRRIASKIIERKGNYALMVKDNQPTLLEEIGKAVGLHSRRDADGYWVLWADTTEHTPARTARLATHMGQ